MQPHFSGGAILAVLLAASVAAVALLASCQADAQTTVAPDGGPIATQYGIWSWGNECRPGEYYTLQNGARDNPGCGTQMQVGSDGGLYADTAVLGIWQWDGSDWVQISSGDVYQAFAFYGPGSGPFEVWRSPDGREWHQIDSSYTGAPQYVRDPDLFVDGQRNPIKVGGLCWMAATNTTFDVRSNSFSLAASSDCVHFSFVKNVPCTVSTNVDCWAPKFYSGTDMHMHAIVSLGPGSDDAFQPYELHPNDPNNPAGTWSASFPLAGDNFPSDMIDTRLVRDSSGVRHLFYKHDDSCGSGCGYIEEAISTTADRRGYHVIHTGDWAGLGAGESPTFLPVGSNWNLYFQGIQNVCGYDGTVLSVTPDLEHFSPPICLGTGATDDLTSFSTVPQ